MRQPLSHDLLQFFNALPLRMSTVGDRIRQQRQKLELTQEKLAKAANISKGFLSDVERTWRNWHSSPSARLASGARSS